MGQLFYLDSSALIKLVVMEAESAALRGFLSAAPGLVSSSLARVEVLRGIQRFVPSTSVLWRARQVLNGIGLIRLDDPILLTAASLRPDHLRSLDALHLASALSLGDDLAMMVVYDKRLLEASVQAGLPVASPS